MTPTVNQAQTHNLISYWQHISDKKLSMPRESSHNHNLYSTLQSFENKSPLFFNPIDPRHFVLVVHLKISLGNEPAIGARQLCGELGICGYFKVILAKAGGNSDVTL